jgi:hypothetical protein
MKTISAVCSTKEVTIGLLIVLRQGLPGCLPFSILLPLCPECWDYRGALPHLSGFVLFFNGTGV